MTKPERAMTKPELPRSLEASRRIGSIGWRPRGLPAVTAALLLAPGASAASIEGVEFASSTAVGDRTLPLHNVGLLRYRIFIKAYVAALYLPSGAAPSQVLDDVPKQLEAGASGSRRVQCHDDSALSVVSFGSHARAPGI